MMECLLAEKSWWKAYLARNCDDRCCKWSEEGWCSGSSTTIIDQDEKERKDVDCVSKSALTARERRVNAGSQEKKSRRGSKSQSSWSVYRISRPSLLLIDCVNRRTVDLLLTSSLRSSGALKQRKEEEENELLVEQISRITGHTCVSLQNIPNDRQVSGKLIPNSRQSTSSPRFIDLMPWVTWKSEKQRQLPHVRCSCHRNAHADAHIASQRHTGIPKMYGAKCISIF